MARGGRGWMALSVGVVLCFSRCLHAQTPPDNDNFTNAIALSGSTFTAIGSNVGATKEPNEPDHAGNPGGMSVWWSWTAPADGYVTLSTAGSDFDTLLAVYTGTAVKRLNGVNSNDDDGDLQTSSVTFNAVAGTIYRIAVDGFNDVEGGTIASGNIKLTLTSNVKLQAPAWVVTNVFGGLIQSSDYRGQVVILNFWSTTCTPCVAEIPGLEQFYGSYAQQGVAMIGVAMDSTGESTVKPFLAQTPLNYPAAYMNAKITQDYGGVTVIPTTVLIDRDNYVVNTVTGAIDAGTLSGMVLPLLPTVAAPRLSVQASDGQISLSWVDGGNGYILEAADTLGSGVWTPAGGAIVNASGMGTLTTSPNAATRFFRLRKP